ncbi:MAG: efflux RND transporter periplasmic adaptor subunit [Fimbriimonadaceae bacterium]|jgi:HlyD family secretion protein|nr:efflux RND transporter periplasmic adaptor subunit [Fimbriimonadaceae bacterium]
MNSRSLILISCCGLLIAGCGRQAPPKAAQTETVTRGSLTYEVVDTGSLEAIKSVEVKSRVGGRVARILVEEGDIVAAGQLIAVIDPQETELQVRQNRAQLRGAASGTRRAEVELSKRRVAVENQINRAKSRLAQIEAELQAQPKLTTSAIRLAESNVITAQQSYDQLVNVTHPNAKTATELALKDAQSRLENARLEHDRRTGLLEKGFIAAREVEQSQLQLELSQTALRQAQEQQDRLDNSQASERRQASERLRQAQIDLDRAKANSIQDTVKREQYRQAQTDLRDAQNDRRDIDSLAASRNQQAAQVDQLRSVLGDSERQLGETEIRAPIPGIVTRKFVQVGELVSSLSSFNAGSPLVRIDDRSGMIVKLNINEIDVARLLVGTPAAVSVDAFPDKSFTGKVTKIAPVQVGATTGTGQQAATTEAVVKYQVEVTLDNPDPALKSGMSSRCTIQVTGASNALSVPLEFVGSEGNKRFVMVKPKTGQGKAEKVFVTTGVTTPQRIEIKAGVEEGTVVEKPPFTGPARQGMVQFGGGGDEE